MFKLNGFNSLLIFSFHRRLITILTQNSLITQQQMIGEQLFIIKSAVAIAATRCYPISRQFQNAATLASVPLMTEKNVSIHFRILAKGLRDRLSPEWHFTGRQKEREREEGREQHREEQLRARRKSCSRTGKSGETLLPP